MAATASDNWLDKLLTTGLGVVQTFQAAKQPTATQQQQAAPVQTQAPVVTQQAQSNLMKPLLIVGGVVLGMILLVLALRR